MSNETTANRWIWMIILLTSLIIILPLVIIWFILQLPPSLALVATVLLIILWGVAAGYKDWILYKEQEEERGQKA
ncbi:MAG: hypothetical protein QXG09_05050 [Candidatus Bathyarchaeia archaeon]